MNKSNIVMVGPSLESGGGISAVVNVYRRSGLFDQWNVTYISSYADASSWTKAKAAFIGLSCYVLLLLRGKMDLLHVHSASRWSFVRKSLFILPAFLFRKPVIFQLHGGEFVNVYEDELGSVAKAYIKFILSRCARVVVLSATWKSMLQDIFSKADIRVVMNPIDAVTVCSDGTKRESNLLLFLGRLEERKGVYDLLEAISLLKDATRVRLLLGGRGELSKVESKINELRIADSIDILGWVNGPRKAELLDTATAVVLPSFAEGLPMSMLEAMAHGAAVIMTPVGGIPDLLEDGEEGILVPPGDPLKLANAIELLLSQPDIARQMGKKGRRKYEAYFSSDVIIPQIEALYSELGLHPISGSHVGN